jgi:hypothetical protein
VGPGLDRSSSGPPISLKNRELAATMAIDSRQLRLSAGHRVPAPLLPSRRPPGFGPTRRTPPDLGPRQHDFTPWSQILRGFSHLRRPS